MFKRKLKVKIILNSGKELFFKCDDINLNLNNENEITFLSAPGAHGTDLFYLKLTDVSVISLKKVWF